MSFFPFPLTSLWLQCHSWAVEGTELGQEQSCTGGRTVPGGFSSTLSFSLSGHKMGNPSFVPAVRPEVFLHPSCSSCVWCIFLSCSKKYFTAKSEPMECVQVLATLIPWQIITLWQCISKLHGGYLGDLPKMNLLFTLQWHQRQLSQTEGGFSRNEGHLVLVLFRLHAKMLNWA